MSGRERPIEIAVDTGGTFTDCVILNFATAFDHDAQGPVDAA